MHKAIEIRGLASGDSIAELTALLHRAYAELGAQGLRFTAVDQPESKTRERIAKGRCFVATLDGAIVGTILYYPPNPIGISEWYRRPGVASFGQFGVEPAHRGKRIGSTMLAYVESIARAEGVAELALDTAEDATKLVEMYTKMGFRIVGYDDWIVTNYRSVVMSKKI
jgi:GNAT superfamily N-acetyltransferase